MSGLTTDGLSRFPDVVLVAGPAVGGLMVGGTALTLLAVWYRRPLFRSYLDLRVAWRDIQRGLPEGLRPLVRWGLGSVGTGLVLLGLVLMPLPGPGSLVVVAAAALLDLEFGWVVPVLNQVVRWCPDRILPTTLKGGLKRLEQLDEDTA